jgi:Replication-relaxation
MHRTRAGKRIELSSRDIEIFKVLRRYRYLRSTYIYAFVSGASVTRFKERLGDLFHEGYLDRPAQQWVFGDARFAPVTYESGKGSTEALRATGAGDESSWQIASTANKQFLHALMTCEAVASLELAVRADEHLRFIAWPEILARAPEATRASKTPLRLPVPSGGTLAPDAVFGLEYRTNGAKTYRFFALEADRGTMPIARSKPGQTSYLGKLAAYGEVLSRQVHRTHWGIPNLLVLTLTNSAARAAEIIGKPVAGKSPAFLFKAVEGKTLTTPALTLLTEPWMRSGLPPLAIAAQSNSIPVVRP